MIPLERILPEKPQYKGSFINGQWRIAERSSGKINIHSPANLDWKLPSIDFSYDHVDETVAAAREAFKNWKSLPLEKRISHVKRFAEVLAKRSERIARFVAIETGKPFEEALAEVSLLPNKILVSIEDGLQRVQSQNVDLGPQGKGSIHFRPKGVMLVVGPFNFPVHLSHGHIVPALLTGNVCILKPSEKTPYSAQLYMEAAEEAAFPPGVLQLLQGTADMGTRLCRHTDIDGILATCSTEVGIRIRKDAAEFPSKIVSLEMGGKNAALVDTGADIESTAAALIRSAFLTTGQRCTALSRVYVQRPLLEKLVSHFHALSKEIVISHPFDEDPKPFMGPLISAQAIEKFLRYSNIAQSEGSTEIMRPKVLEGVARQNRKPLPQGHYVTPSIHVVSEFNAKSAYQSHEIFAPDIHFCPIDSLEEGIAAVNSSRYGLVSSYFGKDEKVFEKVADEIECGLIYFNRPTIGASAKLPFGGWKNSGNHRPAGVFSVYSSTQVQARIKT